jgi:hypothetical protein
MLAKRTLVVAGALGFIGTFLPFFSGDWSSSLWSARVTTDGFHTYLIQLAFLGAAALGAHGLRHGMPRWKGFAAIVCFALPLFELARGVSGDASFLQLLGLAIGAKLVAVGALAGTIAGIVAATQHEPVPRASVMT